MTGIVETFHNIPVNQRRIGKLLNYKALAEWQAHNDFESVHTGDTTRVGPLGPCWWAHQDLNLEPTDYESAALTVELWARDSKPSIFTGVF